MKNESYATTKIMDKAALWPDKRPLLGQLDIELTERCNNNCIHCYINLPAGDRAAREREMSTGEVQRILDEAAALGCLTVRFTGGEPLLRPDFEELYLHARRLGLKVLLFTNGTLITPHLADLLARVPPLAPISITVYGMKQASYEAVTRALGAFEAFWRGTHLLLERGVPFEVKCALLPPNKGEIDEFEAWAATLPGMDRPPGYVLSLDLRTRRDSEEKNRRIRALRLSSEEGLAVLTRRREQYLEEMRAFCARFTRPPGDRLFSCGAGRESGCVDAYGRFQLCMQCRHPDTVYELRSTRRLSSPRRGCIETQRATCAGPLGLDTSLRSYSTGACSERSRRDEGGRSLHDALTDFFPQARELRATNPDYLARCARCFLKGLCDQCPAKSWQEHGTLDTPVEYLCQVAHAKARFFGLLAEGEMAWEVENWRERIRLFTEQEA